ncbi:MAG: type II toxin-antitoxin system RatA family toxin [Phenylobacterium sp.]
MRHRLSRLSPYAPDALFGLVGDVSRYPEFVPWVRSLRTWNARAEADGSEWLDAEVQVAFGPVRERFATRVRRDPALRRIDVDLISGPFRRLRNRWDFAPDAGGTRIDFDIDFEFRSRLLEGLLAGNFDRAAGRLLTCFEDRARTLFGDPGKA